MTRLTIHMVKGDPHVLDFDTADAAASALQEVNDALSQGLGHPVTIAGRLVIRPQDVRSAELGNPPTLFA